MGRVSFAWNWEAVRALKGVMTYGDCQLGDTGSGCSKEETFLPAILLSSSPVLPLCLYHCLQCVMSLSRSFSLPAVAWVCATVQQRYQQNATELGGS